MTSSIKWHSRRQLSQIGKKDYGKEIVVGGWVEDIRNLGGIAFILLRGREGDLQITAVKKDNIELFKEITSLPRESVILVKGKVHQNPEVRNGFEIFPKEMKPLSLAQTPLPLGVADKVGADLDTRFDNRFLDLRKKEITAIFEIRS